MLANSHHMFLSSKKSILFVCLMVAAIFLNNSKVSAEEKFLDSDWEEYYVSFQQAGPKYLEKDFETGIDAPAANNSIATAADINSLLFFKEDRDDENLSVINVENNIPHILDLLEDRKVFSFEDFPKTGTFLKETEQDLNYFIFRDKLKFSRVRPSTLSDQIEPVIENPAHASYPSGHGAQSYYTALVLSDINPVKRDIYIKAAKEISHRREIAGIHFPTDTAAGYRLAENVYEALMQKQEVKKLFLEAKKEFENKVI